MKIGRRGFLQLIAAAAAATTLPDVARIFPTAVRAQAPWVPCAHYDVEGYGLVSTPLPKDWL